MVPDSAFCALPGIESRTQGALLSRARMSGLSVGACAGRPGSGRAARGAWSENVLDYFLNTNQIKTRDGAEIIWYHGANNKSQMKEAIQSAAHMIEADVLVSGEEEGSGQPIMAHPPETDSDNTLQDWLNEIVNTKKGIKLDFKSLAAVQPSMMLLEDIKLHLRQPVWLNADILPGPNGSSTVVDAKGFLDIVTLFFPEVTLSLGWTTGWKRQQCNKGYSWPMVLEMAQICDVLIQPVTFPVRAALVRQSKSELLWLLQKSKRYSLTVWTGRQDECSIEDLLYIRENFDKSRVYYDIFEPQNSEFRMAIGVGV